jgi:hypothetical protein
MSEDRFDYGETLCEAIDTIISKKLEGLSYDITKTCVVIDDTSVNEIRDLNVDVVQLILMFERVHYCTRLCSANGDIASPNMAFEQMLKTFFWCEQSIPDILKLPIEERCCLLQCFAEIIGNPRYSTLPESVYDVVIELFH